MTFDTQTVGALPVICRSFERLDLAATIDRLVPSEGEVSLGALAEILIANRLLRPKALYRIGDRAQQAAVTEASRRVRLPCVAWRVPGAAITSARKFITLVGEGGERAAARGSPF